MIEIGHPEFVGTIQQIVEQCGTFAFVISGLRHAASKRVDWFGGFVCGFAVAIGGGTIRDVMLGTTPFWMLKPNYIICAIVAQLFVIIFNKHMKHLSNTWFIFDTLGLALFTIAGMQKALAFGFPFWVAILMGCITGSAGGVIRDLLLNNIPVIFQKEIYAMASIIGGIIYWALFIIGIPTSINVIICFIIICSIRFFTIRYNISLPTFKGDL